MGHMWVRELRNIEPGDPKVLPPDVQQYTIAHHSSKTMFSKSSTLFYHCLFYAILPLYLSLSETLHPHPPARCCQEAKGRGQGHGLLHGLGSLGNLCRI